MSARAALTLAVVLCATRANAGGETHKPSSYDVQQMIETVAVASPYKMSTSARDGTIDVDAAQRH